MASALAQFGDVFDAVPEIFRYPIDLAAVALEAFERAGQRAHASFHPVGQKRGQDVEEAVCEIEPRGRTPIGRKDLLFHPDAVKSAKRETVDRENIAVFNCEPVAELVQLFGND